MAYEVKFGKRFVIRDNISGTTLANTEKTDGERHLSFAEWRNLCSLDTTEMQNITKLSNTTVAVKSYFNGITFIGVWGYNSDTGRVEYRNGLK